MFESEDEKIIKDLYRETIAREMRRPEIQDAKSQLLSEFFSPAPAPLFSFASAGFLIPSFAVLGIFLLFGSMQKAAAPIVGPATPIYQTFGSILEEAKVQRAEREAKARAEAELKAQDAAAKIPDPLRNHMKPRVQVKRVASQMGPTMVYQRAYRDVPVTIIWVFTGGGHHQ